MDWIALLIAAVKIVGLVFLVVLPMVAYSVYAERRVSAIIQDRVGPNRVGLPMTLLGFKKDIPLAGLFQPLADGIKFLLKEDFTPSHVNKPFFILAPVLTLVPALLTCAVMPFGSELDLSWLGLQRPVRMAIADIDVGPLFIFAISSLGVYGIVMAGWASNSKYSFLGGIRSSSQMISYEISLGLSIIPVLMVLGHLNLFKIASAQEQTGWLVVPMTGSAWLDWRQWVLWIPMLVSFLIFTVSIFAETNRVPFDLPECETELVAGYHTEYSSMKFALFFMGEYAAMIIGSGLAVTLFFGGWSLPWAPSLGLDWQPGHTSFLVGLLHIAVFLAKVVGFILFFIVIRWTLPRFRYDQLMKLGWVWFFEIALANIILTAALLTFVL